MKPTKIHLNETRRAEILQWRKAERERLLAQRGTISARERSLLDGAMAEHLDRKLADLRGATVGIYWPIKAEPNLRRWMERIHARGAQCALPVVIERATPLAFHAWWPGASMARGIWGIPVPAEPRVVQPDVVIAPMVGFDSMGYRLGYGGGYYDRTLASLSSRPVSIGIAYSAAALSTIQPLTHDIPMDCVITESGILVSRAPPCETAGERTFIALASAGRR